MRWKVATAPSIPETTGPSIYYWVLCVYGRVDFVWNKIAILTKGNQLGNRSTLSPNPIESGEYKDYYTITLDIPPERLTIVQQNLQTNGLEEYIVESKERPMPRLVKMPL